MICTNCGHDKEATEKHFYPDNTRSFLFGAAPTGWPPAMQFSWNAYLYTVSQDEKQKARAKKKMWQAGKTFIPGYIAFKDFEAVWTGRKDLSQLLFYKK